MLIQRQDGDKPSNQPSNFVVRSSRGIPKIQWIEDMLADAPWTTYIKINWSPQDILPTGMNVLLANAECRYPSRGLRFS